MNKRTQEQAREGKKSGMARKSASSAKPARPAAASVRVVPADSKARRKQAERGESLAGLSREEKRARKREMRAEEDRVYTASNALMKQDPEYKRLRRIFWVIMGVGIAGIVVSWAILTVVGSEPKGAALVGEYASIGIAYAAIIASFIFDFVKIRPIRNRSRDTAAGMTRNKLNSVIERAAAEEDAKRAAREERKSRKK